MAAKLFDRHIVHSEWCLPAFWRLAQRRPAVVGNSEGETTRAPQEEAVPDEGIRRLLLLPPFSFSDSCVWCGQRRDGAVLRRERIVVYHRSMSNERTASNQIRSKTRERGYAVLRTHASDVHALRGVADAFCLVRWRAPSIFVLAVGVSSNELVSILPETSGDPLTIWTSARRVARHIAIFLIISERLPARFTFCRAEAGRVVVVSAIIVLGERKQARD